MQCGRWHPNTGMVQVTTLASSPSSHQFITAGHDRMLHMWDILSR